MNALQGPPTRPRPTVSRAALLLLGMLLRHTSPAAPAPAYDFSEARRLMESNRVHYGTAGVLAIVEQQGREIFRASVSDGPPLLRLRDETVVAIASCTKWLSGAVILAAAERGYFHLDDPVSRYLPAFDTPPKRAITLRQCFAMTSGLSLRAPDYELDRSLSLAESVDQIATHTPVMFPPGTQLDYEGDGMQVVGRIAEITTGRSWHDLARELLFEPLGMTTARYDVFGNNPAIAGGARCSAADYLRFLRMVLQQGVSTEGRIVLSSHSVQTFFTNQTRGLPERFTPWPDSAYNPYGTRADYGMGSWIMAENPATRTVEEIASPGAFGSFPWVDRRRGLCGVFFTLTVSQLNDTNPAHLEVLDALRREIDRAGLPPAAARSEPQLSRRADGLLLSWTGDGLLEETRDGRVWTPLPWAAGFYAERTPGDAVPDGLHAFRIRWAAGE